MAAIPNNSLISDMWRSLSEARPRSRYAPGKQLFRYGEDTLGIYIVKKGNVDLLLSATSGEERLFERVGPGTLLALSEAISGGTHKLTAVAASEAEISFVDRQDLLRFLRQNPACCMQLVRLLSEDLHTLYHRFQCNEHLHSKPQRDGINKQGLSRRPERPN